MRRIVIVLSIFTVLMAASLAFPDSVSAVELGTGDIAGVPALPAGDIAAAPVPAAQPQPAALTYIDVSIDAQTLTYFVNGAPVLITPCVTGKPGRGTPRGVFAINSCVPGKYLNGPTWHVWVNRWMRFCGNVGIHDATWRKAFGGEIYKSNGSHGCVNIPHDQAVLLYSMVGVGTPVIVH